MRKAILEVICPVFAALIFMACDGNTETAMNIAQKNSGELRKVIKHYSGTSGDDRIKCKAAVFLISNMAAHYTVSSAGIDSFATKVHNSDTVIGTGQLKSIWKEMRKYDINRTKILDVRVLNADYIIDNIDNAFKTWKNTPWHKDVSFNLFCRYILPYRVQYERLAPIGWRDSLWHEYETLIRDVSDIRKAYARVYTALQRKMLIKSFDYPYLLDVIDMERINKGSCLQRCVYMAMVMRALGIPVAVETVDRWANYSTSGHSWVALVTDDGVFTVAERDSVARCCNPVDASTFPLSFKAEKEFPYRLDFKKKCAKIKRMTFEIIPSDYNDNEADEETRGMFINPYLADVSANYRLNNVLSIRNNTDSKYCYLCIYETGRGWRPVAWAKKEYGMFKFRDIGDSIVYMPAVFRSGELTAIETPFLFANEKKYMKKNGKLRRIIIDRKYPLVGAHVKNWVELRGGYFEGSNDRDFANSDTLYKINQIPIFRNKIVIESSKKYRYVRYVSPENRRSPLTELEFWNENTMLCGKPFAMNAEKVERCFDGDTFTTMIKQEKGYSIGLDFGKQQSISHIVFYPKNDGNFVIPGDKYDLFYYNEGWLSLGVQAAYGFSLVYDGVPENALLLLKNKTRGNEERIFTYEDGKQIWW